MKHITGERSTLKVHTCTQTSCKEDPGNAKVGFWSLRDSLVVLATVNSTHPRAHYMEWNPQKSTSKSNIYEIETEAVHIRCLATESHQHSVQ